MKDITYYNINIVGHPGPGEFESRASFSVVLRQDILDDVGSYKFLLHKFKIDTESIPLFHVSLQQPQTPVTNNTGFITTYKVYRVVNGVAYSRNITYSCPSMKPASIVRMDGGLAYYDNRDFVFAIYSYDHFIGMVNDAIQGLYDDAGLTLAAPFLNMTMNHRK